MIRKLFSILYRIRIKLRFLLNSAVRIHGFVRIASTARLKTTQGGSISVAHGTEILDGVLLMTYGGNITIGRKCSINPYTIIYGHGNTTIGDNVLIAGHTMIIPNNHVFASHELPINAQGGTSRGIIIEDDVWIAHGCSILDGVSIGKGSIIGAGAVVTKSIPPYSIAVGVPAKIISNRKNEQ